MALLQTEPKFTEMDRDVLLAIVRSNQAKEAEKKGVLLDQWSKTGRHKLCDEVFRSELFRNPLFTEFDSSLEKRSKLKIRIDAVKWDGDIRFFDLNKDFEKARNRSALRKNFPGVDAVYSFNLPAYDTRKEYAVVYGWAGPTHIHSVQLIAFLKRKDSSWTVVWTKYRHYV